MDTDFVRSTTAYHDQVASTVANAKRTATQTDNELSSTNVNSSKRPRLMPQVERQPRSKFGGVAAAKIVARRQSARLKLRQSRQQSNQGLLQEVIRTSRQQFPQFVEAQVSASHPEFAATEPPTALLPTGKVDGQKKSHRRGLPKKPYDIVKSDVSCNSPPSTRYRIIRARVAPQDLPDAAIFSSEQINTTDDTSGVVQHPFQPHLGTTFPLQGSVLGTSQLEPELGNERRELHNSHLLTPEVDVHLESEDSLLNTRLAGVPPQIPQLVLDVSDVDVYPSPEDLHLTSSSRDEQPQHPQAVITLPPQVAKSINGDAEPDGPILSMWPSNVPSQLPQTVLDPSLYVSEVDVHATPSGESRDKQHQPLTSHHIDPEVNVHVEPEDSPRTIIPSGNLPPHAPQLVTDKPLHVQESGNVDAESRDPLLISRPGHARCQQLESPSLVLEVDVNKSEEQLLPTEPKSAPSRPSKDFIDPALHVLKADVHAELQDPLSTGQLEDEQRQGLTSSSLDFPDAGTSIKHNEPQELLSTTDPMGDPHRKESQLRQAVFRTALYQEPSKACEGSLHAHTRFEGLQPPSLLLSPSPQAQAELKSRDLPDYSNFSLAAIPGFHSPLNQPVLPISTPLLAKLNHHLHKLHEHEDQPSAPSLSQEVTRDDAVAGHLTAAAPVQQVIEAGPSGGRLGHLPTGDHPQSSIFIPGLKSSGLKRRQRYAPFSLPSLALPLRSDKGQKMSFASHRQHLKRFYMHGSSKAGMSLRDHIRQRRNMPTVGTVTESKNQLSDLVDVDMDTNILHEGAVQGKDEGNTEESGGLGCVDEGKEWAGIPSQHHADAGSLNGGWTGLTSLNATCLRGSNADGGEEDGLNSMGEEEVVIRERKGKGRVVEDANSSSEDEDEDDSDSSSEDGDSSSEDGDSSSEDGDSSSEDGEDFSLDDDEDSSSDNNLSDDEDSNATADNQGLRPSSFMPMEVDGEDEADEHEFTAQNLKNPIILQRAVRQISAQLMGNQPWKPPSKRMMRMFKMSKDARDGPSVRKFRLQLGGRRRMTEWNSRAADVFAAEFCRQLPFKKKSKVRAVFLVHLISLRRKYQEEQHPIAPKKKKKAAQQSAAEARKRRLFARRQIAGTKLLPDDPIVQNMATGVWAHLTTEAMSGDETDTSFEGPRNRGSNKEKRYTILRPEWRNVEVEPWLKTHDHIHLWTRFATDDTVTPGRFPHTRVRPSTSLVAVPGKAPIGLPSNWYSPSWLKKLTSLERTNLKMKPPVDLLFSAQALQISVRYSQIVDRRSKPLSRNHPYIRLFTSPAPSDDIPLLSPVALKELVGSKEKKNRPDPKKKNRRR